MLKMMALNNGTLALIYGCSASSILADALVGPWSPFIWTTSADVAGGQRGGQLSRYSPPSSLASGVRIRATFNMGAANQAHHLTNRARLQQTHGKTLRGFLQRVALNAGIPDAHCIQAPDHYTGKHRATALATRVTPHSC